LNVPPEQQSPRRLTLPLVHGRESVLRVCPGDGRRPELCVLHQARLWKNAGRDLGTQLLQQAPDQASNVQACRLKAHWRLPTPLRELIGACYGLAGNNVKRETIVMRLAVRELFSDPDQENLACLRRLAGLTRA
jgi:hypothetical protein